jgi:hypothetical protein
MAKLDNGLTIMPVAAMCELMRALTGKTAEQIAREDAEHRAWFDDRAAAFSAASDSLIADIKSGALKF